MFFIHIVNYSRSSLYCYLSFYKSWKVWHKVKLAVKRQYQYSEYTCRIYYNWSFYPESRYGLNSYCFYSKLMHSCLYIIAKNKKKKNSLSLNAELWTVMMMMWEFIRSWLSLRISLDRLLRGAVSGVGIVEWRERS